MKKMLFFSCVAAALLSFAGCEETGTDFEGTNYIYLEAKDGKSSMFETDSEPITVEVMLTKALEADLEITFALNGKDGVVELAGNPVTISAGEKKAEFTVVSLNANVLDASENYTISVSSVLPEGVELKNQLQFVVSPMSVDALTDAQKAIIEAYKTATGIDLGKYIGAVNVTTVITGTDPDTYEPLDPQTVKGKTIITLSESATAENPVLKMVANPMGIQDHMYTILRSVTVDADDYWYGEYALECYATFMNAINWSKTSTEVFTMSLDGIKFNSDKTIDFLGEGMDQYESEITIVPFDYSFSAYDRELAATIEKDDEWAPDATANPYYHLNCDDITEDLYEGGNWIESTAEISNDSLVFTFCTYACYLDGDYTRVVATYTPNK
jgi:hypothetical protein